jgi:hypothetical protein
MLTLVCAQVYVADNPRFDGGAVEKRPGEEHRLCQTVRVVPPPVTPAPTRHTNPAHPNTLTPPHTPPPTGMAGACFRTATGF